MSSGYVTLMGAEQVQSAGASMSRSADEMRSAAGTIDSAVRDMRMHQEEHVQRLEQVLAEDREKRQAMNDAFLERLENIRSGTL